MAGGTALALQIGHRRSIDFDLFSEQEFKMPDILTLAALKAYALGRRAKWKDYVDLYIILKNFYSLPQIINRARQIFNHSFNEKIFRTQLIYFKDIDYSEKVIYQPGYKISDAKIKKFLTEISLSAVNTTRG